MEHTIAFVARQQPEEAGFFCYNSAVLGIFVNVILPVFLVAALGLVIQRWKKPSPAVLNLLILYLFSPALVFTSLSRTELGDGAFLKVGIFVLLLAFCTLVLGWIAARVIRADRSTESAILLTSTFMNAANLAIPVITFAFGQEAQGKAITFFVTQSVLIWTLGTFIAARSSAVGWRPMLGVLRLPSIYAALAAILVNLVHIPIPATIFQPLNLLGQASIPTMLVVLGFQLGGGALKQPVAMGVSVFIRLVLSAVIAVPLAMLLGLEGLDRQVLIVGAAMPTAVFTTILATEFSANAALVTSSVVFSTAASIVTLTVVIRLVQLLA
ncbi:MAG: AEC family transporter [Dehalococcoidia bacterium]|nr:AEC family transporter [Dehalococcoidia bacterium]